MCKHTAVPRVMTDIPLNNCAQWGWVGACVCSVCVCVFVRVSALCVCVCLRVSTLCVCVCVFQEEYVWSSLDSLESTEMSALLLSLCCRATLCVPFVVISS